MDPLLKRIAAIHIEEDGALSAVWLAHDLNTDLVRMYDCCNFRSEQLPVIAEGLNARGRWIPIAWHKKAKDISKQLLDRGCNMLYDPTEESPEMAEIMMRELSTRIRTARFKPDKRLMEFKQEYETIGTDGGKVPTESFPLMSATRYALANLNYAKRLPTVRKNTSMSPRLSIV